MATPGPRLLSILSLVQFFFIGAGYLLARIFVRLAEKADADGLEFIAWHQKHAPVRTAVALFIRHYGLLFLVAPLVLLVLVAVRDRATGDVPFITERRWMLIGVFTVAVALLFSLAVMYALRIAGPIAE